MGSIRIHSKTRLYATIGGKGIYGKKTSDSHTHACYLPKNMMEGGYGGGGKASNLGYDGTGSGGGATSIKVFANDLWHRVIVSAGGGGTDNYFTGDNQIPEAAGGSDDGSGGAAGFQIGQGWFGSGKLSSKYLATSSEGFTFGQGEAAQETKSANPKGIQKASTYSDKAGAGGGWFGGFASHESNSGAGAGSSWALTKDSEIPKGQITACNEFFQSCTSKPYVFGRSSEFVFSDVNFVAGIWKGNGKLIISKLPDFVCNCITERSRLNKSVLLSILVTAIKPQ